MARNYSSIAEPKTLNGNVTSIATQITLNNVDGLPAPPYVLVLNPDTANEEAVLVNSDQSGVTSPTLKVTRAIESGATAKTHTSTNIVKHMIVGSDLQLTHDHLDNTTTAHGATGAVVGTTNSQTLTNKTINLTNNSFSGTKAQFNAALSDADFTTLTGTETLTNKTLTSPVITGGTVNGGAALTVDSTELNILDGVTASTAELNILDGATLTTTELNYVDGVTSPIQTQLTSNAPIGMVAMWVTGTAPTGWLLCQGQEVPISTYGALAGVLNVTYGNLTNGSGGVGTTHFRLPDLRGRTPMGAGTGTGGGVVGTGVPTGGQALTARTLGGFTGDERIPKHTHTGTALTGTTTFASAGHTHLVINETASTWPYYIGNGLYYTEGNTIAVYGNVRTVEPNATASVGLSNAEAGTGDTANIQPSTVINFIIKF
jgi:microcystin-dependent protein